MELKECKHCGRMYSGESPTELCERCYLELFGQQELVQNYLLQHPNATLKEISIQTKSSIEQLESLIEEGKIAIAEKHLENLYCENCEKPIKAGRYCDHCASEMRDGLKSAFDKKPASAQKTPPKVGYHHVKKG